MDKNKHQTTPAGHRINTLISRAISGRKDQFHPHVRLYDRVNLAAIESGFVVVCCRGFELGMNQLLVCTKGRRN